MTWPRNIDPGCIKFHIPTWEQFDEVFVVTEKKKMKVYDTFQYFVGNIRYTRLWQRIGTSARCCLRAFLAFWLVEARCVLS